MRARLCLGPHAGNSPVHVHGSPGYVIRPYILGITRRGLEEAITERRNCSQPEHYLRIGLHPGIRWAAYVSEEIYLD